jgi:Holliday junction resolvasome RuvABC endonuclease subunit
MSYPQHIRALSLDMATKTGYAVLTDGNIRGGVFGVKRAKGYKDRVDDHEGIEYTQFQNWMTRIVSNIQPHVIFYELPAMFKNPITGYKPIAFRGFMMAEAARNNIELAGYNINTVKKAATGKGNAKKPEMIAAAERKFPHLDILDDNMADALHVMAYGLAVKYGIETL